jgi:hypothetical protein
MSAPIYSKLSQAQRKLFSDLSLSNEYILELEFPPGKLSQNGRDQESFLTWLGNKGYVQKSIGINPKELGILCTDVSLPGSTFATSEVKDNFLGVTQEFAHTRLYTDIDATFYVDRRYQILEIFQGWMDYISGGSGDKVAQNSSNPLPGFYRRYRYPDYYKANILIAKIERDYFAKDAIREYYSRTYQLINAFPKAISSIPISYGPADILKVTVTFNYDRYTVQRENVSPSSTPSPRSQSSEQPSSPQKPENSEQRQARLRKERTLVINSGQSPLSPGARISPRERSINP